MLRILPLLVLAIVVAGVVGAKVDATRNPSESNVLGVCTGGNCGVVTNLPWSRDDSHGYTTLSHTDDKVGVGTNTPSSKLDVSGDVNSSGKIIGTQLCIGPIVKVPGPQPVQLQPAQLEH